MNHIRRRFKKQPEKRMVEYTSSAPLDSFLYRYDISGSIAHANALAKQGIISEEELKTLSEGLLSIQKEIEGLDKSEEFLKSLQMYYEQLLFKLIVDKKSKEIGSEVSVTDKEVRKRYDDMVERNLTTKPIEEIYTQLQWQLFREKQTKAIDSWLRDLEEAAVIEIDQDIVKGVSDE